LKQKARKRGTNDWRSAKGGGSPWSHRRRGRVIKPTIDIASEKNSRLKKTWSASKGRAGCKKLEKALKKKHKTFRKERKRAPKESNCAGRKTRGPPSPGRAKRTPPAPEEKDAGRKADKVKQEGGQSEMEKGVKGSDTDKGRNKTFTSCCYGRK